MHSATGHAPRISFSAAPAYSFLLFLAGVGLVAFLLVLWLALGSTLGNALGAALLIGGLGAIGIAQWLVLRVRTRRTIDFAADEIRAGDRRIPFSALRGVRLDQRMAEAYGTELAHGRPGTAGFRRRFQEWSLALCIADDPAPLILTRSLQLPRMIATGRDLAARLEIPFEHEAAAPTRPAGATSGRLEILPDAPDSPRVTLNAGALLVQSRGNGWFRFGYALLVGAVMVAGVFGMYEAQKRPVSEPFGAPQWAFAAAAGLCFLGAAVQLVFVLLGEDHKRVRVDHGGIHASTARSGSRVTTIALDRVASVQTECPSTRSDDDAHLTVIVAKDGISIRILCRSERDAEWMTTQIREAVAALH